MKLSEIIEEFVDMKIDGPPIGNGWMSIEAEANHRNNYFERLQELRDAIDNAVKEKT